MKLKIIGILVILTGMTFASCTGSDGSIHFPLGLIMVNIQAGSFQQDSDTDNTGYLSDFRMSRHEITLAQCAAILLTDPSEITWSGGYGDPVQMVSWYYDIAY